ncbi:cysteine hydrolase family protein [Streptococcus orisasini]|uniref:cysteine hydrolase family protein n=1 Tax=Streptococcus orisasini TaxID=1080071 RepID=UPI00070EE5DC|nr:cysteine hydrolase family protein [Streptococcus orisasini]
MKDALLIIDVQNDYFPNGKWELHQANKALENVKQLLDYYRKHQLPIYHVQHISPEGAAFFEINTPGADIHPEVSPLKDEKVIQKHFPSAFLKTNLREVLEEDGITHLTVCGMMTHMCIDTTVRVAQNYGYDVKLVDDACTTKDLEVKGQVIDAETVHNTYMGSLAQGFAEIVVTNDVPK